MNSKIYIIGLRTHLIIFIISRDCNANTINYIDIDEKAVSNFLLRFILEGQVCSNLM